MHLLHHHLVHWVVGLWLPVGPDHILPDIQELEDLEDVEVSLRLAEDLDKLLPLFPVDLGAVLTPDTPLLCSANKINRGRRRYGNLFLLNDQAPELAVGDILDKQPLEP